ncbi:MAG TPA: SDR family NAD(P)-dependent oxidoreductase [Pyrinomonadaceae bacterium]|jgi:NAD(P)-dependent dehydrogenase (short-subunit alcohol dehydrogenase family)
MKDKVAIVTGSSQGIGFAIARGFAAAGAKVVVNGRNLEKLEEACDRLADFGDNILALRGDATSETDINRIVKVTRQRFGRIDVLVNNAATTGVGVPVAEMSAELWDSVLNANLRGAFLFSRAAISHLIESGAGRIINIGGLSAKNPTPFTAADAAAKAGLLALTRVLAAELGANSITVNAIIPGSQPDTETGAEFNEKLAAAFRAQPESMISMTQSRTLLKRFETMEEIAATALFLASEAGAAITGQNINVNCGLATY